MKHEKKEGQARTLEAISIHAQIAQCSNWSALPASTHLHAKPLVAVAVVRVAVVHLPREVAQANLHM